MNESIFPILIDDQKYDQPKVTGNKCSINNKDFISVIQHNPKLWCHLAKNKNKLDPELLQYINNISSKFEPEIPNGTLARIKVPSTDWQSSESHRYIRTELVHCANYDLYLLPFHDHEHQYAGFFVDIGM